MQQGWCCLSILPPLCPPPGDSIVPTLVKLWERLSQVMKVL